MSSQLQTISPIDDSVYVTREYGSAEDIERCLALAKEVQGNWRRHSIVERAAICNAMVDAFVGKKQQIAEELAWMMGRPIRFGPGEVAGFEERARYMIEIAAAALVPVEIEPKPGFIRKIKREPLGVVFVIAPWNYPYLTAVNSIVPAIMAGNSVVLKHSAQTPLCAERIAEAFAAAGLPEGVFQYLHLTHDGAEMVIADQRVEHVCFTGSVRAGGAIEQAAAGRFIGVGLELGGKDPAYVRGDADLKHAVETVVDGAYFNSGQSCCGIERVYVHETVFQSFVEQAVELVNRYRLGRSDDPETTLGPMVNAAAADFVRGQVAEAIEQGAHAHIDPQQFSLDKPGTPYLAPQLLTGVNHDMRVMTEESFGPVVGVQKVRSDEEAVELMNDSEFGLTAALFTRDIERGMALGEAIETGTFFINRCDYLDPALAWTGVKHSGRGCTLSRLGYEQLTRPKSFHVKVEL